MTYRPIIRDLVIHAGAILPGWMLELRAADYTATTPTYAVVTGEARWVFRRSSGSIVETLDASGRVLVADEDTGRLQVGPVYERETAELEDAGSGVYALTLDGVTLMHGRWTATASAARLETLPDLPDSETAGTPTDGLDVEEVVYLPYVYVGDAGSDIPDNAVLTAAGAYVVDSAGAYITHGA
jgi:hypothetical protein